MLNEKILQLFSFLSRLEQSAQIRKRVLSNYYEFDPAKIFEKIDTENKGQITPDNISSFLNNHNIQYTNESLKLLIIFYDTDFDGVLSFQEFLPLIQNDNALINNKKLNISSDYNDISFNIEYCVTKIFEKELELNQYIINILIQINKNIYDNLSVLFNDISLNKDYISQTDIMNYLDENKIDYTKNQINDIMKRLDINKDGKIDFNEFDYLFGLAKSNNVNNNLNNKIRSLNNYSNFYDNNLSENYIANEEYNGINKCDPKKIWNNSYDLEKIGINQNNNEEKENSFVNLNNNDKGSCIHCISFPFYECNCSQNQINQNTADNKNPDYYLNSFNNFLPIYDKYNYNYRNIENNQCIKNNINNYDINNIYENKENEDFFSNYIRNNNENGFGGNNNIYYQKNYKYEDNQNDISNNNLENKNIKYNNSINNNTENKNRIDNNIFDYNNEFENLIPQQSLFPIKNGKISKSLFLRKSPVRKILSKKNNQKLINYNLNNYKNDESYFYQENANDNLLNKTNNNDIKNTIKNYNNFNGTNSFIKGFNSENNNPLLKRNNSQGNFIINKNNLLKKGLNFNNSNIFNINSYNIKNQEKNEFNKYFLLIMEGESQIDLTKKNLISRKDFNCKKLFNLFDEQNKGYTTSDELKNELKFIGVILNDKEIQLLINRFNRDKNKNIIEFNDFCYGMNDNLLENEKKFNDIYENNKINIFSPTTRLYFKALIKSMVELENKLNNFKKENMNINNINDIIVFIKEIDFDEKGFFNINDLINYLKEKDIYSSLKDSQLLFSRFDKGKKRKIYYEDILSDLKYI